MFLSRNKKNNVYPCQPQFYYIKVGFKGVKIIYACSRDVYFVCNVFGHKRFTSENQFFFTSYLLFSFSFNSLKKILKCNLFA